ncbi:unnamed protein product [Symbiodinium microadriaticum]|nr:unnamed protein product [Symbiodinium microadriaticum]
MAPASAASTASTWRTSRSDVLLRRHSFAWSGTSASSPTPRSFAVSALTSASCL